MPRQYLNQCVNQFLVISQRYIHEWILLGSASFFFAAIFTYHVYDHYKSTISQKREQLTHSAEASVILLNQELSNINTTLDNTRRVFKPNWDESQTGKSLLQDRLVTLASAMPHVEAISIINKSGTVIASSMKKIIGNSFTQRDYFRIPAEKINSEQLYVSSPFKGIYGSWLLGFSKVILDSNGKFAGISLIVMNSQSYSKTINALRPSSESFGGLTHSNGLLFVWQPQGEIATGKNLNQPGSLLDKHVKSGKTATFYNETVLANNERSLASLHTVKPEHLNMDNGFILAVGQNFSELLVTIKKEAYFNVFLFLLVNIISITTLHRSQRTRWESAKLLSQADEESQQLKKQITTFFNLTPSLMFIVDKLGNCIRISPSSQKKLGYTLEDFEGSSLFDYIHPDDQNFAKSALSSITPNFPRLDLILRIRTKAGNYLFLEYNIALEDDLYFIEAIDVTQRELEKSHLKSLAYHDRLTGLPNRALFFERLEQDILAAEKQKSEIAVLFIDLDGFKAINDNHGHNAGDLVLVTVAKRLSAGIRGSDTIARLGGDEFIIILNELNCTAAATKVATKILSTLAQEITLESGADVNVGASIGISIWPDNGISANDLIEAADNAMYESKNSGKNRFTLATK